MKPAAKPGEIGVGPFSMTDEEKDIAQFGAYLGALSPDALWDVLSHLDEERYPRRREAVVREMAHRRLFFVVPYTRRELQMRAFLGLSVFLAVLAVALKGIAAFPIELSPNERLPFFLDLAVGAPRAAGLVLPLVRGMTMLGAAGTLGIAICAGFLLPRRQIRGDIAAMAVLAALVIGLLLLLLR